MLVLVFWVDQLSPRRSSARAIRQRQPSSRPAGCRPTRRQVDPVAVHRCSGVPRQHRAQLRHAAVEAVLNPEDHCVRRCPRLEDRQHGVRVRAGRQRIAVVDEPGVVAEFGRRRVIGAVARLVGVSPGSVTERPACVLAFRRPGSASRRRACSRHRRRCAPGRVGLARRCRRRSRSAWTRSPRCRPTLLQLPAGSLTRRLNPDAGRDPAVGTTTAARFMTMLTQTLVPLPTPGSAYPARTRPWPQRLPRSAAPRGSPAPRRSSGSASLSGFPARERSCRRPG